VDSAGVGEGFVGCHGEEVFAIDEYRGAAGEARPGVGDVHRYDLGCELPFRDHLLEDAQGLRGARATLEM